MIMIYNIHKPSRMSINCYQYLNVGRHGMNEVHRILKRITGMFENRSFNTIVTNVATTNITPSLFSPNYSGRDLLLLTYHNMHSLKIVTKMFSMTPSPLPHAHTFTSLITKKTETADFL